MAVTLACAFPRGRRGDWLVEKATELGVAAFAPLVAERSVLHGPATAGSIVGVASPSRPPSSRVAPSSPPSSPFPRPDAVRLIADLEATATIPAALAAATPVAPLLGGIALYVGPEGGWSPAEREALLAEGVRAPSRSARAGSASRRLRSSASRRCWPPPAASEARLATSGGL